LKGLRFSFLFKPAKGIRVEESMKIEERKKRERGNTTKGVNYKNEREREKKREKKYISFDYSSTQLSTQCGSLLPTLFCW
jgi:hypothetical protein